MVGYAICIEESFYIPLSRTKSFAFYIGDKQVYEKSIAESLHTDLSRLYEAGLIEDLTLIDSNPQNNPQPPEKIK